MKKISLAVVLMCCFAGLCFAAETENVTVKYSSTTLAGLSGVDVQGDIPTKIDDIRLTLNDPTSVIAFYYKNDIDYIGTMTATQKKKVDARHYQLKKQLIQQLKQLP